MKKFLPYLLLLSAFSVSISAAFYSVYGLSKLFSGAATQVIIMASSLEVAKIIIAAALHRFWNVFNLPLKIYLTFAIIVLVIITSAGIYGYLSNAYQITYTKDQQLTKQTELIEYKKSTYTEQKIELIEEKNGIIKSIESLRSSLGNNILQTVDKKTGQLIKSTSGENRKSYELQLNDAINRRDKITDQISVLNDSITSQEIQIINLQKNSDVSSELGPLKYISKLTNKPMDQVVNWFLILLMIVFDPLAIALVLASSFVFLKTENKIFQKEEPITVSEPIQYIESDVNQLPRMENPPSPPSEKILNDLINKPEVLQSSQKQKKVIKKKKTIEPEMIYEPFDEQSITDDDLSFLINEPDVKKKEISNLDPEQIRNMSHQQVRKFLEENL